MAVLNIIVAALGSVTLWFVMFYLRYTIHTWGKGQNRDIIVDMVGQKSR